MAKGYGLYFVFIVIICLSCSYSVSADNYSLSDLETIVVTKSNIHLANTYSLNVTSLESSPFDSPVGGLSFTPLDLQSRSLAGAIQTDFSLRGSGSHGVLVLLDGRRINDPQTSHHNSDIPLTKEDISRIEVIPGLSSSLFGPDAVGGAINIILKRPQGKSVILESGIGSYQTRFSTFSITDQIGRLNARFSLERQESGGFRYDTDFKKLNATFVSLVDTSSGEFDIKLGYQEKEFGAYDFYTPKRNFPSKEWTKTLLLNTGFNLVDYDSIINPNFLWRRHYDKFMLDKTQVRSKYLNHHRTDIYVPSIYLKRQLGILGRVGLGVEYGCERVSSTSLGRDTREHTSIYVDSSKNIIPGLSLGISARVDDYRDFDQAYSGSLKFRYEFLEEYSFLFGVSRSIRIPDFTELRYNGPTTVGNLELSEEKAINLDAGIDYKKTSFSWGVTFFLRKEEDFIDWIKHSPAQSTWKAENITKAEVGGLEGYLRLALTRNTILDTNYNFINRHIDGQGYIYKYGSKHTQHILNTVFNFNLPCGRQTVGLTYKKKRSRHGWVLLNSYFSYNINKISQIFIRVTNLFNVEYQEIDGIPQPGRWSEIGMRFKW